MLACEDSQDIFEKESETKARFDIKYIMKL